ncbi:AAA family ATPase [Streptomyces sp. 796.1]|uniref:AAA family ATPase n=1 Tax=Streptomyces sp. 796.1 TaxID=3163029 RepID=UPI0039C9B4D6
MAEGAQAEDFRRGLAERIARFDRGAAREGARRAERERARVAEEFPVGDWLRLPLERYALGPDNYGKQQTFCRLLEYGTDAIGSIRGGSAAKHIIYQHRTGEWRVVPAALRAMDVHDAWERLRKDFAAGFAAAGGGAYALIDEMELLSYGQALTTKALATYFPEAFLPVFSAAHVRHFTTLLGGHSQHLPRVRTWRANRELLELVRRTPEFDGWLPNEVTAFLYAFHNPRPRDRSIWKIAPGAQASLWADCLARGVIRVGWDEVGSLVQYESDQELKEALDLYWPQSRGGNLRLARQLLAFRDLEPGDRIVANKGKSEVLAVGRVTGGYTYDMRPATHRHSVYVEWNTSYAQTFDEPRHAWQQTLAKVPWSVWREIRAGRAERRSSAADELLRVVQEGAGALGLAGASEPAAASADTSEPPTADAGPGAGLGGGPVPHQQPAAPQQPTSQQPTGQPAQHSVHPPTQQPGPAGHLTQPLQPTTAGDLADPADPGYPLDEDLPDAVRHVRDLLEHKGQVVVQGPPGTGKTRLALSVALALAGQGTLIDAAPQERAAALAELAAVPAEAEAARLTMVTFHPSYGYEDFIEGFKPDPAADGAGLNLQLKDGLFRRVCEAAAAAPGETFLVIVDEINRGDLPRILGELITLLELDKRGAVSITLPTSGRQQTVPPNVRIIGTMNSADRSVGHIDAAIRRRFAFYDLPPDLDVLDGEVEGLSLADFLQGLNDRLDLVFGPDHLLGQAYLLAGDQPIGTAEQLSHAFHHEIVPLVAEYCLGQPELLRRVLGPLVDDRTGRVVQTNPQDLPGVLAGAFAPTGRDFAPTGEDFPPDGGDFVAVGEGFPAAAGPAGDPRTLGAAADHREGE